MEKTIMKIILNGLLFFVFLLFFSVEAASAATKTIIVNSTSDLAIGSDTFCTLREAIGVFNTGADANDCVISGGGAVIAEDHIQIILTAGSQYNLSLVGSNENSNATGDLDITRTDASLEIKTDTGGTTSTINQTLSARVLHTLGGGTNLTLRDLQITGGYCDGLLVDDGCGLYNQSGAVLIVNTTFYDNNAGLNNSGGGDAGALASDAGNISIVDSTFASNTGRLAGAIDIANGNLIVSSTNFVTNSAYIRGGVISLSGTGYFAVTSSLFASNTVITGNGGVVYSTFANIHFYNTRFLQNHADGGSVFYQSSGTNPQLVFDSCVVEDNYSSVGAGAVYSILATQQFTVNTSTFRRNYVTGSGGAIYMGAGNNSNPRLVINNSTFIANTSTDHGGAIYTTNRPVTFTSNTFYYNYAGTASFGGAIHMNDNTDDTTINYFTSNLYVGNFAGYGAALRSLYDRGSFYFTNETYTSNNAQVQGGAFWIGRGNLYVSSSVFTSNSVNSDRGGVFHMGGQSSSFFRDLYITNSTFDSNFTNGVSGAGGVVYITGRVAATSSGNVYKNNAAWASSGGVWSFEATDNTSFGPSLYIINDNYYKNYAKSGGGAIEFDVSGSGDTLLDIVGTSFLLNKTVSAGGGAVNSDSTNFTFGTGSSTVFDSNNAAGTTGGGAIYRTTGALNISDNVTFMSNSSTGVGPGGTINITSNAASHTLNNVSITNSFSGGKGGAVYFFGTGSLIITSSSFSNNTSTGGGGAFSFDSTGSVFINSSTIHDNYSAGSTNLEGGGGILSDSDYLVISTSTITSNTAAASDGGGIAHTTAGNDIYIIASTISGNASADDGGGLAIRASNLNYIQNSTISGNVAQGDGGGILISDTTQIIQSTIVLNTALATGAGIYDFGSNTYTLYGNILAGNTINGTVENCAPSNSTDFNSAGYNVESSLSHDCNMGTNDTTTTASVASIINTTLQDKGGRTLVHDLASGSPAIDLLVGSSVLYDQLGQARTIGSNPDAGSYEASAPSPIYSTSTIAAGVYGLSTTIDINFTFDQSVTVNVGGGTPYVQLNIGGTTVNAPYISGSPSTTLLFSYVVQNGNNDTDGVDLIANSLNFNGGAVSFTANPALTASTTFASTNFNSVFVDTSAPTAPTVITINNDTGLNENDYNTTDQTLIFSGTAEGTSTVYLGVNGTYIGSTTANAAGAWSFDYTGTTLAEASYTVTSTASDVAYNTSTEASFTLVVDQTAPGTPTLGSITNDTGVSGDFITNDQTLVFNGTSTASGIVSLGLDGVYIGSTTADGTGNWSFNYTGTTITAGAHTVTSTVSDAAGNTSSAHSVPLTIDITAPGETGFLVVTTDSGNSSTDRITNDNTLVFTGTSGASEYIAIGVNGVYVGQTQADGGGNWSYNYTGTTLGDATYTVSSTASDTAGNTSTAKSVTVTVDTSAPSAPTNIYFDGDNGTSSTDYITNDQTLIIMGSSTASGIVYIGFGGTYIGSTTADGAGFWSFNYAGTTLGAATYTVTSTVSDLAGNTSTERSVSLTIDTTAPTAPSLFTYTNDTGVSATDGITSDNTVLISGTSTVGDIILIGLNGVVIGTATTNGAGNWSINYTGTTLADASYTVTTTASDSAGNVSASSAGSTLTIDTVAPVAPAAPTTSVTAAGNITTGGSTTDQTLIFQGAATAGATVAMYLNGTLIGTTIATGGAYSFDYTATTLAIGAYSLTAREDDSAGNRSADGAAFTFTVAAVTVPSTPAVEVDTGGGSVFVAPTAPAQQLVLLNDQTQQQILLNNQDPALKQQAQAELEAKLEQGAGEESEADSEKIEEFFEEERFQAPFLINGGDEETDSINVWVLVNINNVAQMAISEDPNFAGAVFEPFIAVKRIKLSPGNGVRKLHIKVVLKDGRIFALEDSIKVFEESLTQEILQEELIRKQEQQSADEAADRDGPTQENADQSPNAGGSDSDSAFFARSLQLRNARVERGRKILEAREAASKPCEEHGLLRDHAYKVPNHPSVWYIDTECTRRAYNKPKEYFTYFEDWSRYAEISPEALAAVPVSPLGFMPLGPLYDPKYGAIVKVPKDPRVFLLLGEKKYWIVDEEIFVELYGDDGWNWIEDVDPLLLESYPAGGEITDSRYHPPYTLVKYEGSNKIYQLQPDDEDPRIILKRHIVDQESFERIGYRWDRIVTINRTERYPNGPAIQISRN